MTHRWTSDAEIEESKRQASTAPVGKSHHYVPQVYLRRWADGDGRIRMTKTATGASRVELPQDMAKRNNFYTIAADDLEPDFPSRWFEKHMSRVESDAAGWLAGLDRLPNGRITDSELIGDLAVFVALQDQRTLRKRDQDLRIEDALNRFGRAEVLSPLLPFVCHIHGIPYSPRDHDAILKEMLAQPLISSERKPRAIESAIGVWRNTAVPYFATQRAWWLIASGAPLLTCDEPVVYLGGGRRGRSSVGSWMTSPIFLFPAGPHRLLVLTEIGLCLTPPFLLNSAEAAAVNFEMVAASHEFCFEQSDTSIAKSIRVPAWPEADVTSAENFMQAVLAQSRWAEAEGPPWALARWLP